MMMTGLDLGTAIIIDLIFFNAVTIYDNVKMMFSIKQLIG